MPSNPPILHLLDVSNNNPQPIDWKAVAAAGITGAILKRSEGTGFADPTFSANWQAARAAGIAVLGCYHFAHPGLNSPQSEAAYFLSLLPTLQPGDLVALDIEVEGGQGIDRSAWALAWLQMVQRRLGFAPLVYSYPDYIIHSLANPALAAYPLWLASLDSLPPAIAGWPSIALWQNTWTAHVPGVMGNVDESSIARDVAGVRVLGAPPMTRTIAVACGLKLMANHTCVAVAQLPAGAQVQVLGGPIKTDDIWFQIVWNGVAGYVPASKLPLP